MGFTQIYTNTTTNNFATRTGDANGAALVSALVDAFAAPGNHLPTYTKPNLTDHPNSLFLGCGLNYMRIKILTTGASTLGTLPTFHVYGWSKEARSGLWDAKRICAITPGNVTCATTNFANVANIGQLREIFDYGTTAVGDTKIYNGTPNGGGFFLIDTIGTELLEIHFSQSTTANGFAALCGSL